MAKHIPGSPSPAKIATAEKAIAVRFANIDAALNDLKAEAFGVQNANDMTPDSPIERRYCNRVMQLFILISHMRDDVLRLTKRSGLPKQPVMDFIEMSTANAIIVRAGDTAKHGLGGQSNNSTILNGLVYCQKITNPDGSPTEKDECLVVSANVVDAVEGAFSSRRLIEAALHDWVRFLNRHYGIDYRQWFDDRFHNPNQQVVRVEPGVRNSVPAQSRVVFDLPKSIHDQLVQDVIRRADEA